MKNVGILVAMHEEAEAIRTKMQNREIKKIHNLEFEIGQIENVNCVLVKSGIGKVNAARTTQVLLDNFDVECIINVGAAGAINYSLNIGDVLIAENVVQHDFDLTAFGHKKGYITGVGEKIQCDANLLNKFKNILDENKNYNIKKGIVASGDIFCTDENMKNKIYKKFNADVVDMECSAIGQVAYLNNVPFISIRCISDIPNGENASTFDENLQLASTRCADIVQNYCQN
ncbi:MAG: 5'-methylthioadenosine/adenosylhomocysteine nucleosidase [Clostridia bacterium]|nr:5'-methylthioadenosine/adenosylhomocysteine nucleosidase [Clostridia bacterium]